MVLFYPHYNIHYNLLLLVKPLFLLVNTTNHQLVLNPIQNPHQPRLGWWPRPRLPRLQSQHAQQQQSRATPPQRLGSLQWWLNHQKVVLEWGYGEIRIENGDFISPNNIILATVLICLPFQKWSRDIVCWMYFAGQWCWDHPFEVSSQTGAKEIRSGQNDYPTCLALVPLHAT